ncbi:MAG: hypothetical protein ABSB40_08160 [Nitrososphaeria archaeon]
MARREITFIILSTVLEPRLMLFLVPFIPIISSLIGSVQGLSTALTSSETLKAILTSFYCAVLATVLILIGNPKKAHDMKSIRSFCA